MSDANNSPVPSAAAEVLDAANPSNESEVPEAVEGSEAASPEAASSEKKVDVIEAKKDSGEKLTKKEEKILKEYKLKVNGREKSVKFDPSNDVEMQKYLQKAYASDEAFQQAAEVRKAAMQFLDDLKKNPKKVLSDPNINIDLKKFAEEIMNEAIQEMEKSPEQKEREKLQKELNDIKKQREDEKKTWEEKEMERLQVEHERQLETDISAALDIGGLPKTARTVKTMAEYMMIALQNNIELTPQEIVPIVKNNTLSEFKEILNSLNDDQLEDFVGKEIIGRLRKRNIAKSKAPETANAVKATGESTKKPEADKKNEKPKTYRDFFGI